MNLPRSPLVALSILFAGCPTPSEVPDPPDPVDHPPVRFIAIGDTGEGNPEQYAVAEVMETVCAANGCDFALLLGDNIYASGVHSLDDVQWQDKFELPYAGLDFPFWAVLGNHDYGLVTPNLKDAAFQIAYTDVSDKWRMPASHYAHSAQNVDFFALNTHSMMFPNGSLAEEYEAQRTWIAGALAEEQAADRWRVVYGHHPYRSNGEHGNAGAFDGLPDTLDLSGISLKEDFEASVCGRADLYVCGHDHDREWFVEGCGGTELIVSGAGSKLRTFEDTQPTHFADASMEGFVWIEIDDEVLTLQFWNRDGVMEYEGGWERSSPR